MYKYFFKPILFLLSPDFTHRLVIFCGRAMQSVPLLRWFIDRIWRYDNARLEQSFGGVKFKNPVGLSAGFDKNVQLTALLHSVGFGFATGGSVTLEPRKGNPRPWFHRLPKTKSVVVFAGMPNYGLPKISKYIKGNQERLADFSSIISVAVIANYSTRKAAGGVASESDIIDDVKKTIDYITKNKLARIIEINISCPNAGKEPFIEPEPLDRLLTELDGVSHGLQFWIKMPHLYDMERFDALLKVVTKHNIQGAVIANLVKDRSKAQLRDPLTDDIRGGLSGEPTRDHSLRLIRHAYENYGDKLYIIGVGGVFNAEDAYAKIRAGASLIGLVTGLFFEGPQLVGRLNKGLVKLLDRDGFSTISEAIGADLKKTSKKSKNL